MAFDLTLDLVSQDFEIASVYGSDKINKESGNIMHITTLFPYASDSSDSSRGEIILFKLKKVSGSENGKIDLKVSYTDNNGQNFKNSQIVDFYDREDFYENTGIRKAIILCRYANALKQWILYERTENMDYVLRTATGITDCDVTTKQLKKMLGKDYAEPVEFTVGDYYKNILQKLKNYVQKENETLNDRYLKQEVEILENLLAK